MSFAATSELHEIACTWEAERCCVEHPLLEQFSGRVGQFKAALAVEEDDPFWGPVVRRLIRLRWQAATTPLRMDHEAVGFKDAVDSICPRLRMCAEVAPEFALAAAELAEQVQKLARTPDDPFGDEVVRLLASPEPAEGTYIVPVDPRKNAVLVSKARYVADVVQALRRRRLVADVVTPRQLIASGPYDIVVGVGAIDWFEACIFRAPRAKQFKFVYPGWIRDRDPELGLFYAPAAPAYASIGPAPPRVATRASPFPVPNAEDFIPVVPWTAIAKAVEARDVESTGEPVIARLFVLASGDGVYLEEESASRAYVADIDEGLAVRKRLVSEINPGTYVVVRTEGDGDYISAVADKLLDGEAQSLRRLQQWWKRLLNQRIHLTSFRETAEALSKAGAPHASEGNLRRWARPDSIRTRDPEDFRAILRLIGAESRHDAIWTAMDSIDRAHLKAAMQVRALLVREIERGDVGALRAQGWADYDVEEIEGEGTLRIARVDARAPEPDIVPPSRTRRLFDVAGDLWRA